MTTGKPSFEYAIICDDIREEVGQKLSLMGIYMKSINIPALPFTFPKLCFFIACKNLSSGDSFSLELFDPDEKIIGKPIEGTTPEIFKEHTQFTMSAIFSPLIIHRAGMYRLIFSLGTKLKKEIEFEISVPNKA